MAGRAPRVSLAYPWALGLLFSTRPELRAGPRPERKAELWAALLLHPAQHSPSELVFPHPSLAGAQPALCGKG